MTSSLSCCHKMSPMIFSSSIKIPSSNHPAKPLNYLELFYRFGGSFTLHYLAMEKSPFRSIIFPVFLPPLSSGIFQPCVSHEKSLGPEHKTRPHGAAQRHHGRNCCCYSAPKKRWKRVSRIPSGKRLHSHGKSTHF